MNQSPRITGAALIGATERLGNSTFKAVNPATGEVLSSFHESDAADVAAACALADEAFLHFSELPPAERAHFLETIAEEIVALGDALVLRAVAETALPRARIESERGRTTGQLRFFAGILREGAWLDATVDPAQPDRVPQPRPDLRRRNVGLGPVAVFGASNFPLAFSVAGGDSAAALAAGCPVVVKGHPAHAGTGELVARAVRSAAQLCGLPAGVFSYLPGTSHALGGALVAHPQIQAVGFTGSRAGGQALMRIAAARPQPIPVYAEMSSINPVFLFPAAAHARGADLGRAYVGSLTLGAGQFCTNPGLLIAVADDGLDAFLAAAVAALGQTAAQTMLTADISARYAQGVRTLEAHAGVESLARGLPPESDNRGRAALFSTRLEGFVNSPLLGAEVFGASSLIVRAASTDEFVRAATQLEGQLTATVLFDTADEPAVAGLLPSLARRVGRIIGNGWPTGVEVAHAMVHGGPYPATSDGRSTSVGALAIERFLRPVCYQNLPDTLLPPALRSDNPWHLPLRVDGVPVTDGGKIT
ncbi:MAG: aldehyde dehydrogenase (NADP(+)) [Pseudomonadota bacterium]